MVALSLNSGEVIEVVTLNCYLKITFSTFDKSLLVKGTTKTTKPVKFSAEILIFSLETLTPVPLLSTLTELSEGTMKASPLSPSESISALPSHWVEN